MGCELCENAGGEVLWEDDRCRAVWAYQADHPGFCRVIWEAHVKEMTDLSEDDRMHLMEVVFAVESVLREHLEPDKINLASLGNVVPHLHWHVIARFADDAHFPDAIWAAARRAAAPRAAIPDEVLARAIMAAL